MWYTRLRSTGCHDTYSIQVWLIGSVYRNIPHKHKTSVDVNIY